MCQSRSLTLLISSYANLNCVFVEKHAFYNDPRLENLTELHWVSHQTCGWPGMAADVLAHEIGHGLGMYHDFYQDSRGNRYGYIIGGRPCTGINSIMDYVRSPNKWSPCSDYFLRRYKFISYHDNIVWFFNFMRNLIFIPTIWWNWQVTTNKMEHNCWYLF